MQMQSKRQSIQANQFVFVTFALAIIKVAFGGLTTLLSRVTQNACLTSL